MKKRSNNKGFILLLVVALIPLAAVVVLIIGAGTETMADDSRRAYLQACERNLAASGAAWAQQAAENKDPKLQKQEMELDVELLQIPKASLAVSVTEQDAEGTTVEISTYCRQGKRHLKQTRKFFTARTKVSMSDNSNR